MKVAVKISVFRFVTILKFIAFKISMACDIFFLVGGGGGAKVVMTEL